MNRSISVSGTSLVCLALSAFAANPKWVPYSAKVSETVSTADSSGQKTVSTVLISETRANDGSLLRIELDSNGKPAKGKLWKADGTMFRLDFIQKQAVELASVGPRHHSQTPPDAPLGSKNVAGLQCLIYPIHGDMPGSICVDVNNDIPARTEVNIPLPGRAREQYVSEVTSIDLDRANVAVAIPDGFTVLNRSQSK